MEFRKISSPTLKQLFIEEIESMILTGKLPVGTKLPTERELAQKMQVSRSVVNDGIAELSQKGFLTILPRQGTYVADYMKNGTIETLVSIMKHGNINREYIYSTLTLREHLISLALDSAVENMTKEQFREMEDLCAKFENEKDAAAGAGLLYEIDHHISCCCSNLLLPILFSSFRIPNCILFERYLNNNGFEPMRKRNLSLLEAFQRKNTEQAKQIMKESIEQTIQGKTEIYQDKNK